MATMDLEEFMTATEAPPEAEKAPAKEEMGFNEFMGTNQSVGVPMKAQDNLDELSYGLKYPDSLKSSDAYTNKKISDSFSSFTSGLANFTYSTTQIPALTYGVAAIPQNALARVTGWNIGAKTPEWMIDNPISKHFKKASEAYNYRSKQYPGEDLASLMKKGDYSSAGDYLTQAVIENAPNSIAAIAGSIAGIPEWQVLAGMGTQQAASSYQDARSKNLGELEAATNAVLNGGFEAVFERTPGLVKWGEELFKDVGKQTGKAILKNTFKMTFGSMIGEGNEEFWTQLTQDFTNKVYGVEDVPLKDFIPRAIEAATIGAVSGATMTAPGGVMAGLRASSPENVDAHRAQVIQQKLEEHAQGDPIKEENVLRGIEEKPFDALDLMRQAEAPTQEFHLKPDVAALQQGQKIEASNHPESGQASTPPPQIESAPQPFSGKVFEATPQMIYPSSDLTSSESIANHPDFVNLTNDAAHVVRKYAEERGLDPTAQIDRDGVKVNKVTNDLFTELHDAYGEVLQAGHEVQRLRDEKATPEEIASAVEKMKETATKINAKYPDLQNEFATLRDRLSLDLSDNWFRVNVQGKYGQMRPQAAIDAEGLDAQQQSNPISSPRIEDNLSNVQKSSFKRYNEKYGDNRPESVVKKEFNDLVEMGKKGIQPNFTQEQIDNESDSLRRKWAKKNPDKKLPGLSTFNERAREILQRKFDQSSVNLNVRQRGIKSDIREVTGQVKNQEKTISEYEALRESMRVQARAADKAAGMTRQQIEKAQTDLIGILEDSGMEANDKAKFIRAVKNIQNQEDLQKALPEISQRIEGLIERSAKRKATKAIQKELKKIEPKKQSGKPVGKFTPEIQVALNLIKEASHLTAEEANARIEANIAKAQDGVLSDDLIAENRILEKYSGIEERPAKEIGEMLAQVKGLKAEGRTIRKLLDLDRRQQIHDAVGKFVEEITGKQSPDSGAATFGVKDADENTFRSGVRKLLRKTVLGWNDVLNILSGKSKTRPGESFIEKFANVFDETQAEKGGVRVANEELRNMVEDSFGLSGDKAVLDHLREDTRPVNLGKFTNAAGVEGDLVLNKAQARKKWMEMQDPTLQETFDAKEGMAYTPEIRQAIENFLTPEDKKFAQAQLDFYKKYYQSVNEVYKNLYGINLPKNETYSPIKRSDIGDQKQGGFGEFIQEINVRRSATSASLKSRVKNIRPLDLIEDTNVLQRHVAEMEHFKNWAEKIRDLQSVFGNAQIKQAIIENQGKDFYKSIFNFVEDFSRGGVDRAKRFDAVDKIRIKTTQSSIALRPSILVKQLTSTFAYLNNMSPAEFISGVADFWKDPKGRIAILKESEFLRNRSENIDRDIADSVKSEAYKAFRKKDNFINRLMLNVQIGDQGAIVVGGWAVYKKALEDGKSHEEALREFAKVSNETQQSGDLAEQSEFQRGGSFAKLFTMFQSAPNQYLRREIAAIRNAINGRITKKEAAKTLAIYHVLLPMIFQWVSDFGQFKPGEQVRAAVLGNVNGLFILGDMIEGIWRSLSGLRPFGNELPIYGIAKDFERLGKFFNEYIFDDVDEEDIMNAIMGLLGVVGFSTGVPARQAADMIASMAKIQDEDYREGIGGLLGWPQSALREED